MSLPSYAVDQHSQQIEYFKDKRLEIRVEAKLELRDGSRMTGKTKNLSYCGAFIELQDTITVFTGEDCILSLVIHDKPNPDILKLRCSIKHINQEGVGVQIESIDDSDLDDFVFLLANSSNDPNAMLTALSNSYSIDLSSEELA